MDSFKLKNKRVKYNFPVGYVHEYLTVTSEAYSVRKSSKSSFRCVDCLCACGNVAQVSLSRLGSGKAKSCDCYNKEQISKKKLSDEDRVKNSLFREYKLSAKQRHLYFELSAETLFSKVRENCTYCGNPPSKPHRECESFLYNGLDRIDNDIGYVESNITPCCFFCNKMKGVLSVEAFMKHINKIFYENSMITWL